MRQFILPSSYHGEATFALEGKESQYLSKVLRLKVGQQLLGRDQKGGKYMLTLQEVSKNRCLLFCTKVDQQDEVSSTDTLPAYRGPYPNLTLLQCLCKGRKEEQIFRQATEIGVSSLALVSSRYCIPDLSEKKEHALTSRFDRLEAQVKEALQQSGSPLSTTMVPHILPLEEVPKWWNNRGLALFFHQSEREQPQQTLTKLLSDHPIERPIAVLVGPEGGFSDEECTFLEEAGFHAVLLKTNILRSETAGVYALSAIQVILTERETKPVHL